MEPLCALVLGRQAIVSRVKSQRISWLQFRARNFLKDMFETLQRLYGQTQATTLSEPESMRGFGCVFAQVH